MIKSRVYCF